VYPLRGSAFGLNISSEIPLPGLTGEHETFGPPLAIRLGAAGEPGGHAQLLWETRFDGLAFALHRSASEVPVHRCQASAELAPEALAELVAGEAAAPSPAEALPC
jgi:hypothetical protein